MRTDDFDFELPEDLIALRPVRPRSAARMLVAREAGPAMTLRDGLATDLPSILTSRDMLVFNDTRVLRARLEGVRRRDSADGAGVARIEATLLERAGPAVWRALARPGRRLAVGDVIAFDDLSAAVTAKTAGGVVTLRFDREGAALDAAIERVGAMPLPPYIAGRRAPDAADLQDYQTIFAAHAGSVAAPTASLHFDEALMAALAACGVRQARLTLHVGAGTFLPVKAEAVEDHRMHAEWGEIGPEAADAINQTRRGGGRVIAVGTTALRLLESAADGEGRLSPWRGETDIFITPGYRFRAVDGLMTNFHLPRSTLFMLVCAMMGVAQMRRAYAHAVAERYRFFSYGDASLLLP